MLTSIYSNALTWDLNRILVPSEIWERILLYKHEQFFFLISFCPRRLGTIALSFNQLANIYPGAVTFYSI